MSNGKEKENCFAQLDKLVKKFGVASVSNYFLEILEVAAATKNTEAEIMEINAECLKNAAIKLTGASEALDKMEAE